ncbi:unnamed protein product [Phytophthora fragariaefolia]|uniref:Unnamed protein product n=1 Tax=Phytophthora fragariaefolia TaxID=1490495 RepID=A0A9W6XZZ2_9STRA|nr:unnamed protein product [Phytophthora fragariaefolia]
MIGMMMDIEAVGSDLTSAQQDEVMADLSFFLDEFGSTRAVRVKLQEQQKEIRRLMNLKSGGLREEDMNNEEFAIHSSEHVSGGVNEIMVDLEFFLRTFGSTRAVREKLEDQKREIAYLYDAVQQLLGPVQTWIEGVASSDAAGVGSKVSSPGGSNEGGLKDAGQVMLQRNTGQVDERRAEGGDSGKYGGDVGDIKPGYVDSQKVDIVVNPAHPETINQHRERIDMVDIADQVAMADVVVRNVEIEVTVPSLSDWKSNLTSGGLNEIVRKDDSTTGVGVDLKGIVMKALETEDEETPEDYRIQSSSNMTKVINNVEGGGVVAAYYKLLKNDTEEHAVSNSSHIDTFDDSQYLKQSPKENSSGVINQVDVTSSANIHDHQPTYVKTKYTCRYPNCSKNSQARGLCYKHGGYHLCKGEGCSRRAITKHLCRIHGGGKRCRFDGCRNLTFSGGKGYCCRHARERGIIVSQRCKIEDYPRAHRQDCYGKHNSQAGLAGICVSKCDQPSNPDQCGDSLVGQRISWSQKPSSSPSSRHGIPHETCRAYGCMKWVKRDGDPNEYCIMHREATALLDASGTSFIHPDNQAASKLSQTEDLVSLQQGARVP